MLQQETLPANDSMPNEMGSDNGWITTPPPGDTRRCIGPNEQCQRNWCDHVWCGTCGSWGRDTGVGPSCGHNAHAVAAKAEAEFLQQNQLDPYPYVKLLRGGGLKMDAGERHAVYTAAVAAVGPMRSARLGFSEAIGEESGILWLPRRQPERYDYVRQFDIYQGSKVGRIRDEVAPGMILGWTTVRRDLSKSACPHLHRRRVFFVKPYDRGAAQDDGRYKHSAPADAVDPRTLAPGEPGFLTERAWGGSLWDLRIRAAPTYEHLVAIWEQAAGLGQWTDHLTAVAVARKAELGVSR
ncbi:DUF6009 family protein [Micromonospora sp. NPDC049204]|uniref:DUF6009 family protein n=1 Tax=Micromonospora sp. NPDC049204 TaxID=3154351 RepID=UPI00340A6A28